MTKNKKILIVILFALFIPGVIFGNNIHQVYTGSNATDITDTTATLSGSAIPIPTAGSIIPVYGYFRYSTKAPGSVSPIFCNEVFGDDMKSTVEVRIDNNASLGARKTFSTNISNLEPNTTYYYCAVASDKKVIEYGLMSSFTTANDPNISLGSVITKPATAISATSAYLNGTFNSAVPSSTWFEYRKKRTYQDLLDTAISQAASVSIGNPFYLLNPSVTNQTNMNTSSSLNQSTNQSVTSLVTSVVIGPSDIAQLSNQTTNPYQWSGKINYQTHTAGARGIMSYPVKNLEKNKTYEFRAVIQTNMTANNSQISYGDVLTFRTSSSSVTDGDIEHESTQTEPTNLSLGDTATPPDDAIVRYHEGIEHVLVRQLMRDYNRELIEMFGYQDTMNLETFAWDTADFIARTFGYVSSGGKEIRVVTPDIAAYQLVMKDGKLTIYEYFDGKIVDIQDITSTLRNKYEYEYYYTKKVSQ